MGKCVVCAQLPYSMIANKRSKTSCTQKEHSGPLESAKSKGWGPWIQHIHLKMSNWYRLTVIISGWGSVHSANKGSNAQQTLAIHFRPCKGSLCVQWFSIYIAVRFHSVLHKISPQVWSLGLFLLAVTMPSFPPVFLRTSSFTLSPFLTHCPSD